MVMQGLQEGARLCNRLSYVLPGVASLGVCLLVKVASQCHVF